ncbi:hypothetical protein MBLNU230_g4100t1 [Neophaeotheca triangularis]
MPDAMLDDSMRSLHKRYIDWLDDADPSKARGSAITVTLTPPYKLLDKRTLTIAPNKPQNIGRASKSQVKNLEAGPRNALFDCPVVSRTHAELKTRFNVWMGCNEILITDNGSMHGTYVNEVKLRNGEPFTLQSGDEIRLGDKVSRGEGYIHNGVVLVFSVVNQSIATDTSTTVNKGFTVPEISDYSDDEYDFEYDSEELRSSPSEAADRTHWLFGNKGHDSELEGRQKDGLSHPEIVDTSDEESVVSEEPIITQTGKVTADVRGSSQEQPIELDGAESALPEPSKPKQATFEPTSKPMDNHTISECLPDLLPSKSSGAANDTTVPKNIFKSSDLGPKETRDRPWEAGSAPFMSTSWATEHTRGNEPQRSTIPGTYDVALDATNGVETSNEVYALGDADTAHGHCLFTSVPPSPFNSPFKSSSWTTSKPMAAASEKHQLGTPLATAAPATGNKRKADSISADLLADKNARGCNKQEAIEYLLDQKNKLSAPAPVTTNKKPSKWDIKPIEPDSLNENDLDPKGLVEFAESVLNEAVPQENVCFDEQPPRKKAKLIKGSTVKTVGKEAGKALGLMAVGAVGMTLFMASDFAASLVQ